MEAWKNVKKRLLEALQRTLILGVFFGFLADWTEKGSRKYVFGEDDFFMIFGSPFSSISGRFWLPLAKTTFTLFGHFFDIFRFFRRF